ncbi:SixA phosphatase family protein [Maribacter sp. R77961]|uniref:SixA phosphatase family protein n=1 Tax=Maribacter sp. R77961 TaxID=3093871 RepID=UPI0037C7DA2A
MKNLLLMRHGKSSWELNVSDEDRALLQRGISDTKLVAQELALKAFHIDYVFSSPANRALHTAMISLRELRFPLDKFEVVPELYDFSGNYVIDFIKNLPNELSTVLIFGHNHAFTHIANSLGSQHIENVPTAGFVHLQVDVESWASLSKGTTIQTIFPKQLKK